MSIMSIVIFIIGSPIVSAGATISLVLRFIKDVADQGYKIKFGSQKLLAQDYLSEEVRKYIITLLIPGANLFSLLDLLSKYNYAKPLVIDRLKITDSIEPFSEEEAKKYNANKTGFNAMNIGLDAYINDAYKVMVVFTDGNALSKMWLELDGTEFIIDKCEGPLSELPPEEQKAILNSAFHEEITTNPDISSIELKEKIIARGVINLNALPKRQEEVPPTIPINNTHLQEIQAKKRELQRVRDNFRTLNNTLGRQLKRVFKNNNRQQ